MIVNRDLAERIDSTGQVLGTRIRQVERSGTGEPSDDAVGPWLEIVGVVPTFPTPSFYSAGPRLFQPLALDRAAAVTLAIRVRSVPTAAFAPRLREIAFSVDPALEFHELQRVAATRRQDREALQGLALMIAGVTLSVLLLSAGGIYAMMAFTVAKRRREIGIRAALGANPRRILSGIFARAAGQLGAGAIIGVIAAALIARFGGGEIAGDRPWIQVGIVAAIMIIVGLLAALGPAREGLAVQPSEALRAE